MFKQNRLGFIACIALAACAKADERTAEFSTAQCKRVSLIDQSTGEQIIGAEDLALDRETGSIFISAYDRRSAERAAKRRSENIPSGGLYRISVEALVSDPPNPMIVESLARPLDIQGGLRPHGIYWDDKARELLFINRAYDRDGRRWRLKPRLERIGGDGEPVIGAAKEISCAANDISVNGEDVVTSVTHSGCGWRAGVENLLRLKRSGIETEGRNALFSKALYANGVTNLEENEFLLAATREKAILRLTGDSDGLREITRFELSGAPDNLSLNTSSKLVAAVHPSLMRLSLNRKLGIGKAPSRIVEIDLITDGEQLLFDDPTGEFFSAASVAVRYGDALIAGSATDRGLLVCDK